MLVRLLIICTGFVLMLLREQGIAQSPVGSNVKVGVDYRAGLAYSDNMLEKRDGDTKDPDSSLRPTLHFLRFEVSGEAAKHVDYLFSYQPLRQEVQFAHVDLGLMDKLTIRLGRDKPVQGGFAVTDDGADFLYHPGYSDSLAFDKFQDEVALLLKVAGVLKLQFIDDVARDTGASASGYDATYQNTSHKQPTALLEWLGDFNGWHPLLQLASYDKNKSMYYTLGVRGNADSLRLTVDYVLDSRNRHDSSLNQSVSDKLMQFNIEARLALPGYTPFVWFSQFSNAQGEKSGTAFVDKEANTFTNRGEEEFDDNKQQAALGVECTAFNQAFRPYVVFTQDSGKFYKAATDETNDINNVTPVNTETRSAMMVSLGFMGTM